MFTCEMAEIGQRNAIRGWWELLVGVTEPGICPGLMQCLAEYIVPSGDNATSRENSGNFRCHWLGLDAVGTFGMKV